MYQKISTTVIIVLLLSLMLACIPCFAEISATDMTGRDIVISEPIEKIVVLSASDCEMLYAIGAGDLIAARGEYCDYPEEILALPSVQSGYETNIEQIIAIEPQLVIMTKMGQTIEQVEAVTNAGIPVLVTDAQNIGDIYANLELLGSITGKQAEAAAVAEKMKADFEEIASSVTAAGKKVYFEVSPLEWGLWASGSGTFLDELADMFGLKNIFGDLEGWASVSEEQVIALDPDFIITTTAFVGDMTGADEILGRAAWHDISAVSNNKVMLADYNLFTRPGPRLTEAAKLLAEYLGE